MWDGKVCIKSSPVLSLQQDDKDTTPSRPIREFHLKGEPHLFAAMLKLGNPAGVCMKTGATPRRRRRLPTCRLRFRKARTGRRTSPSQRRERADPLSIKNTPKCVKMEQTPAKSVHGQRLEGGTPALINDRHVFDQGCKKRCPPWICRCANYVPCGKRWAANRLVFPTWKVG